MNYREQLIDGRARIGVWGCGYIGFTTMVNYAKEGIYSVGYDVNDEVVKVIQSGQCHIPNLDYWIGYHLGFLVEKMIVATGNEQDMMANDVKVHFIAVPTEKGGEPYNEPLKKVVGNISRRKLDVGNPDLVIIESTLTPGVFDGIVVRGLEEAGWHVGKDILVGIAPRRDWFDSPEKNLKALKRVVGGTTPQTSAEMRDVLSIVCDNLIVSDASKAELVKSVENSIFHICAVYASQLARAYPNVDMSEVLELASTHWRIPRYFPSVGTGGYCIPVSSKYVKAGATHPEVLKLTDDALTFDANQPCFVADLMAMKSSGGAVGVLGLSYKRDLKVHILSPTLRIVERLKEHGVSVKVYDPYYSGDEVRGILGVDSFQYPDELSQFHGVIVVTPHRMFGQTPKNMLLKSLGRFQSILDNEGIWKKWRNDFASHKIDYHCVGDKGWCLVDAKRKGKHETVANEVF